MKLISHRGNTKGKTEFENSPIYILSARAAGYDVEIDVWYDSGWWLGHDEPVYKISFDWINRYGDDLWVHCKNLKALHKLMNGDGQYSNLNYFWHQNDDFTITSHKWIWTYPGKELTEISICVLPETSPSPYEKKKLMKSGGICSDFIEIYKTL